MSRINAAGELKGLLEIYLAFGIKCCSEADYTTEYLGHHSSRIEQVSRYR